MPRFFIYSMFLALAAFGMGYVLAEETVVRHESVRAVEYALGVPFGSVVGVGAEVGGLIRETEERRRDVIVFVGDVMLGRHIEALMNEHGAQYPFEKMRALFERVRIVSGNLEGPIPSKHAPTPSGSTKFSFDKRVADVLAGNNFKILSLANNHTYDLGADAFLETMKYLGRATLASVGHPISVGEGEAHVEHIGKQKIVFAGLNATYPALDTKRAVHFIESLQDEHSDGFLVVHIHWGDEYTPSSNSDQQNLARALADAGADLIIGHHPHVVQEVESYGDALIFYSLGNFIFDQYFSEETQQGLAIALRFIDDSARFELIPTESTRGQPEPVLGDERRARLAALAAKSSPELANEIREGVIVRPLSREDTLGESAEELPRASVTDIIEFAASLVPLNVLAGQW